MNRMRMPALLLAVVLSSGAAAQQPPGAIAPPQRLQLGAQRRKVSLREALQLAAKQGPDVAAARAQAAIAEASVRRAWTAWQPDLVATGTYDHTSAPSYIPEGAFGNLPNGAPSPRVTLVAPNSRYAVVQLTQPFLTPQGLFLP